MTKAHDIRVLFRRAVDRFGSLPAVEFSGTTTSYEELDRRADGLAATLLERGVRTGDRVAILSVDSRDVVTSILGTLRAGAAFVPLDPRAPRRRLERMIATVDPRVMVLGETADPAAEPPEAGDATVVRISGGALHVEADAAGDLPWIELPPDALCYVYFTSGSTGDPKGIAGRLKAIAHFIRWEIEILGVEAGWRTSQLTSPGFDAFLRDMFVPLCSGGTLCLPSEREILGDGRRLADWLGEHEVHLVHTVPSLFRTLLSFDPPRRLPDLRWILLAGEPLRPADVSRWSERQGESTRLMNLYGPTETTMTKFFHRVEPGDGERRSVPIGKPMPGTRALVLDGRGNVCPTRAVGEIYIRTPFRSLGYYGRPDLTREVFVPNPFSGDPADLIYKTGDLGRVLEDGAFEFLGRRDEQVKIRGVRVELTEVEGVLARHPAVRDAVVVDRSDADGTTFLCAYVVPEEAVTDLQDEVRPFLAEHLPEHSLPSVVVSLEELPRTLTGKVDRRALPAPELVHGRRAGQWTPPRSATEEIVADLFARTLDLARVGIHENFFQLGGHSLLATQLLARVRSLFGVELSLRKLFTVPTIAGVAAAVEQGLRAGDRLELPPLEPVARTGREPLSFAQERLWFIDRLEPGRVSYNIPLALRMEGELDVVALARALATVEARHEALRTTFPSDGEEAYQRISAASRLVPRIIDLTALPDERRLGEARAAIRTQARVPFELDRGPLVRMSLQRIADADHLGFLCMHHIVSDAWSLGVLVRELTTGYDAFHVGRRPELPELPVQYADYAVWQRGWLQGAAVDESLAYWKERLSGIGESLRLPTDRHRSPDRPRRGGRLHLELQEEGAGALRSFCLAREVTLFMALLATLQALLHRWSGQSEIRIGSPIANRDRPEVEGLVGFFVNTLVLDVDVSDDPSFTALLARSREAALNAYAHQHVPFETLIAELGPERHLDRTPLFQVLLVLQNAPLEAFRLPGLSVTPVPVETGAAKFDLAFAAAEESGRLQMAADYDADLFDGTTVERLGRQLLRLLELLPQAAERRLSELPVLSVAERFQTVLEWSEGPTVDLTAQTVVRAFDEQVERTPDAVAVTCGGHHLSYGNLDEEARRLAHRLRHLGVGAECTVGLCLERSSQTMVAVLGVLKAGAAYVPLDPRGPAERLGWMVEDSGVSLVLVGEDPVTAGMAPPVLRLATLTGGEGEADPPPVGPPSEDGLAYVLYTSGSTGRPKGVEVGHRQLLAYCRGTIERLGIEPAAALALVLPLTVDSGLTVLFPALLSGGRLCVVPHEEALDAEAVARVMESERIDGIKISPSHLRALAHEAGASRVLPSRWLVLGGEASPRFWVESLTESAPHLTVYNHYGPTEATVGSTSYRLEGGGRSAATSKNLPIGRPHAGDRCRLLDRHLSPVPVGVAGELFLGGVGVARGYRRQPARTAVSFLPDPWAEAPGSRLYRTGDLARFTGTGDLEFLGRSDEQVKIRGLRIELGEIDEALARHPAVTAAAVRTFELAPGDTELVAYVVVDGAAPSAESLRRHVGAWLPAPMLPTDYVFVDSLPRTANGKLDRRALPAPPRGAGPAEQPIGHRNPVEGTLAALWTEVGLPEPGPRDDFFELGGHSLLATRVVSRVREAFQVDLPLRDLFDTPTLSGLARRIEALRRRSLRPEAPPIRPVAHDGGLPLSFAQQRLWFLNHLEPDSSAYNMPLGFRLDGHLDSAVLVRALSQVIHRHEVLRTTYSAPDGRPRQVVASLGTPSLPLVDLTGLEESVREQACARWIRRESLRPFDLERGPVVRFLLLRLRDRDHRLLVTVHHIASDGWSLPLFAREVVEVYRAATSGEQALLPELPVQYGDYAHWQREWLRGETLAAELEYWTARLAQGPALLELPADRPRPHVRTWSGAQLVMDLDEKTWGSVRVVGRQQGATPFMVLLGAFSSLLGRLSGEDELRVGTPVAARDRLETENLIGFLVNTLIVPCDLSGDPPFSEVLRRTRATLLEVFDHQELPFERLVEEMAPERSLTHTPLFQVMLAFQNLEPEPAELPGLEVTPLAPEVGAAKFDLTLLAREVGDRLRLRLEYATELFDETTALRVLSQLRCLLSSVGEDAGRQLSALPLLDSTQRHQVLIGWNDTPAPPWQGRTFPELFQEAVERHPDAVAVRAGDREVRFRDLGRQVEELARRLRAEGTTLDGVTGIFLEPSVAMVVAVLATLEAGGAYLPLDSSYPDARLHFLVADSRASVVITDASLAPRLSRSSARLVRVDSEAESADTAYAAAVGVRAPAPENLAYVIYTSGSTGVPKGVMVPHRALLHYLSWSTHAYLRKDGHGALVASPLSFDLTVTALFTPLLAGQPVEVPAGTEGPEELAEALRARHGLSFVKLTPAHLEIVSRGFEPGGADGRTDLLVLGGETLHLDAISDWRSRAPSSRLVNEYGPTEATVGCCVYEVPQSARDVPGRSGTVPIGRAIRGTRLYVLDPSLRPLPPGAQGELHVAGGGLGRGYLRRPRLTAERWIPDPFGDAAGGRLYATGDRARQDRDGVLYFLGRLDRQIKIRGFRVEPGEVEAALSARPEIATAAVVASGNGSVGRRLVAYVVPAAGAEIAPDRLRESLGTELPSHLVPTTFVTLDELPLTSHGKVDYRALPEPGSERPALTVEYAPPSTPTEERLAAIWADVLRIAQVGVHDNFFHLGGDSILSIQIVSRAVRAGLRITTRQVFEHQTVAELARVAGAPHRVAADQRPVTGETPLTPIQRWFFERRLPARHHHHQGILLETRRRLDARTLARTLRHLLDHHDALRLCFKYRGGDWRQTGTPPSASAPLLVIDLGGLPEGCRSGEVSAATSRCPAAFDLGRPPLLRAVLFRLGPGRSGRLLLTAHHLVVDGVSWRILLEDLQGAYERMERGQAPETPPKTSSFQRWAHLLEEQAGKGDLLHERSYWLAACRDLTPLPRDLSGDNLEATTDQVAVVLGVEDTADLLRRVPAVYRTRIDDVLLTVLARAFRRWTGSRRLLVDLEGHGRDELLDGLDLSRTVGWFTVTYPVVLSLPEADEPGSALMAIKEQLREVPGGGLSYGMLRYLGDRETARRLAALPAPEVGFNYLGQLDAALETASDFGPAPEAVRGLRAPEQPRPHLIDVTGRVFRDRLEASFSFSLEIHRRETVERLADAFLEELRVIVDHCRSPEAGGVTPSDFPMVDLDPSQLSQAIHQVERAQD